MNTALIDGLDVQADADWRYLLTFLPAGWQDKMCELGLLKFGRQFDGEDGPEALLRTLMIHLAGNLSLRSTCAVAYSAKIVKVSDVALLKRLKKAHGWFAWLSASLRAQMPALGPWPPPDGLAGYRLRLVDATVVAEPGATGSNWRLHFGLNAATLAADEVHVGDCHRGESLANFTVQPGDVLVGDRAYARRKGIAHVVMQGGQVVCRLAPRNLPLYEAQGQAVDLLANLRQLADGEVGDFPVYVSYHGRPIRARVCAIRQAPGAAADKRRRIHRQASKKGIRTVQPQTLEYADYFLVITTLPETIPADQVLALYRYRWQLELYFKRLKSLLQLSALYKRSPPGMLGWLSGKLFIATLIDYLRHYGERFSPWGYPLPCDRAAAVAPSRSHERAAG